MIAHHADLRISPVSSGSSASSGSSGRRRWVLRPALLLTVAALLVAVLPGVLPSRAAQAAQAAQGGLADPQPRAVSGFTGSFPDPTILLVGDVWWAASTTFGVYNVPMMSSPDLTTWSPDPLTPDAMPQPPAWAQTKLTTRTGQRVVSAWAPSLGAIGGRYLLAYSAAVSLAPFRRHCIGVAAASSPQGPYVPTQSWPLLCYNLSQMGVIDPDFFVAPDGTPYLTWKQFSAGSAKKYRKRTGLMIRQLTPTGDAFAPGSKTVQLLAPALPWEGGVVENPSLIEYAGRYFLFYSANDWQGAKYATGYAACAGPLGPCERNPVPLMSSNNIAAGPGGADAFIDPSGQLRLIYAAYEPGMAGVGERRIRLATVSVDAAGALSIATM